MNGPTEFHVIRSLKNWSIVDRLHSVAAPTLVISGRHEEATPLVAAEQISGAEWRIFEQSSRMPYVEERTECIAAVVAFLDAHE
jgi:L-proline amide hydrolase